MRQTNNLLKKTKATKICTKNNLQISKNRTENISKMLYDISATHAV